MGYTRRSIWSVGFIIIGIVVWPLTWPVALQKDNMVAALVWGMSWAVTGVFPLIPVNMAESLFMMCVVWCAMIMSVDADRTFI